MNLNLHSFASRRRKLNVEEVFDMYPEVPAKSRKVELCDEVAMFSPSMDLENIETTLPHHHPFPVNSFPLMGLNDRSSDGRHAAIHHPTKQPLQIPSFSPCAPLPSNAMFKVEMKDTVLCATDSTLHCDGLKNSVHHQQNLLRQQNQESNCPDCLSGKSGHFYHIQDRLQGHHQ